MHAETRREIVTSVAHGTCPVMRGWNGREGVWYGTGLVDGKGWGGKRVYLVRVCLRMDTARRHVHNAAGQPNVH